MRLMRCGERCMLATITARQGLPALAAFTTLIIPSDPSHDCPLITPGPLPTLTKRCGRSGFKCSASATFVSGPSASTTTSPGHLAAHSTMNWAAEIGSGTSCSAKDCQGGMFIDGRECAARSSNRLAALLCGSCSLKRAVSRRHKTWLHGTIHTPQVPWPSRSRQDPVPTCSQAAHLSKLRVSIAKAVAPMHKVCDALLGNTLQRRQGALGDRHLLVGHEGV